MNSQTEDSLNKITGYEDRFKEIQAVNILSGFKYSGVRDMEFDYFRKYQKKVYIKNILEFPADGLYLNKIFPNAKIDKADLLTSDSSMFPEKLLKTDFSLKNIKKSYYDAIFCVTPIHHATDMEINLFISACHSCLKVGGFLVVAEVMLNSKVANFLDSFVNKYSLAGHIGNYPDIEFLKKMEFSDFGNLTYKVVNLEWIFNSEIELVDFITLIFGLKTLEPNFILNALNDFLGLKKIDHKLYLDWELIYFDGRKKN